MTPNEFNEAMRAHADLRRDEVQLVRAAAYWSAALSRAKNPPTFKAWMNPEGDEPRILEAEEAERRAREHAEDVAAFERLRAEAETEGEGA